MLHQQKTTTTTTKLFPFTVDAAFNCCFPVVLQINCDWIGIWTFPFGGHSIILQIHNWTWSIPIFPGIETISTFLHTLIHNEHKYQSHAWIIHRIMWSEKSIYLFRSMLEWALIGFTLFATVWIGHWEIAFKFGGFHMTNDILTEVSFNSEFWMNWAFYVKIELNIFKFSEISSISFIYRKNLVDSRNWPI